MEVTPTITLLMSSRLFWHLSRGELDLVRLYLKTDLLLREDKSPGARLSLEQLRDHLVLFMTRSMRRFASVALHDESRFDDAIALYESILRQYPVLGAGPLRAVVCKKRPRAESRKRRAARSNRRLARRVGKIGGRNFRYNPMFEIDAVSRGDLEQKRMMRRLELRQLWKDRRVENQDYLRYAEVRSIWGIRLGGRICF